MPENQTTVQTPTATVTTTMPNNPQQPNVVYVEKKSKTWIYVIIGIVVAVLCCCGVIFALLGGGLLATMQYLGPAMTKMNDGIIQINAKYAQYKDNTTFQNCLKQNADKTSQAQMQAELQAKFKDQQSKDPNAIMDLVVSEVLNKVEAMYSSCAAQAGGSGY